MKARRNRVRRYGHNKTWTVKRRNKYWNDWMQCFIVSHKERIVQLIFQPTAVDLLFKQ